MQFVHEKIHKVLVQDDGTLIKNTKWQLLGQKHYFSKIFANNSNYKLTIETKLIDIS
jgi:hypothetical protein